MEYKSYKIKELIDKSENKELLLPNFQRQYVWERTSNQKDLVASILFDIPIGSLLILNGESGFFATKELCIRQQFSEKIRDTTLYLLDGQQRISTIKSIFFDFFSDPTLWRDNFDNLYPKLRTRWFLKVKPEENKADIFGWKNLKFNGVSSINIYSPNEIADFIEYCVLRINQSDKWYHPEYQQEQWYINNEFNTNIRKNIVSREAAKIGWVPLYTIISNEKGSSTLHYKTLKKIAQDRVDELKALVKDNKMSLDELFDGYDKENIDDAWNELLDDWVNDVKEFLVNVSEKEVPIIQLVKEEMSRAVYTFERVNKGGTALSTYDLVVAKAAYNKELDSLTDRIINIINEKIEIPNSIKSTLKNVDIGNWEGKKMQLLKDNEVTTFMKNQYLNLLSIFSYFEYEIGIDKISLEYIKKDKHLNIEPEKINNNTEVVIRSLLRACAFLQFRCGIVKVTDLSYQLMILPIAYMLRNNEFWNSNKAINKIEYWYWSSLFGGAYRKSPNEQCITDIKKLYNYIANDIEDKFKDRAERVLKVEDYSDLDTLTYKSQDKKIPSAIDNGILQYVLSKQPKDFIDHTIVLNTWDIAREKEYKSIVKNKRVKLSIQDHHICPLSGATRLGESTKELRKKPDCILNSPLNRTYISTNANSIISDKNPQDYFLEVSELAKYGHCIPFPINDNFRKNNDESDEDYYSRVVSQRYHEICKDLNLKLDKLK